MARPDSWRTVPRQQVTLAEWLGTRLWRARGQFNNQMWRLFSEIAEQQRATALIPQSGPATNLLPGSTLWSPAASSQPIGMPLTEDTCCSSTTRAHTWSKCAHTWAGTAGASHHKTVALLLFSHISQKKGCEQRQGETAHVWKRSAGDQRQDNGTAALAQMNPSHVS